MAFATPKTSKRSHHHNPSDVIHAPAVDLPTEKEARFDHADSNPNYAAWFKVNHPDEYAEWLTTKPSKRIVLTKEQKQAKQAIIGASQANTAITPETAPSASIKPVITCDLTALAKHYEARANEQAERAELAWLAFGELLDACIADFTSATGFMTVYEVDLMWLEAIDTSGLKIKSTGWRYTFYGPLPLLTERYPALATLGTRASQIYRDLKLSEALMYRYSWQFGEQVAELRKEYRAKEVKAA